MIGSTLLAPRASSDSGTWHDGDDRWYGSVAPPTKAGIRVNEEVAMSYATIFACVNKRAKTIATLPVYVVRDLPGGRRERVSDHLVRKWFTTRFNPEAMAVPTRWAMMANLDLWGNAYFEILFDRFGRKPIGMVLLYSKYMTVDRDQDGDLVYIYREPGKDKVELEPRRVLHIAGFGYNGIVGLSVIGLHRETAAIGLATTEFRAGFLGSGATAGTVITRPADAVKLTPVAEQNIVNSFNANHAGSGNAFKTALLSEGMTLGSIGMSMDDAQFVELSRYDRETWCGVYDVPPSMIHDNTRSTYTNAEQQAIQWVMGSLLPACVLIESSVDATFFDGTDLHLKINTDGLRRGDFKTRMHGYYTGRNSGLYCTNDMRRLEDLDPVEGGDDDFWRPKNMSIKGEPEEEDVTLALPPPQPSDEALEAICISMRTECQELGETVDTAMRQLTERQDATSADVSRVSEAVTAHQSAVSVELGGIYDGVVSICGALAPKAEAELRELHDLLLDPATRAVAKETKAVSNAIKRAEKAGDTDGLLTWLDKFYTDQPQQLCGIYRPTVAYVASQIIDNKSALAGTLVQDMLADVCEADAEHSVQSLSDAVASSNPWRDAAIVLDQWKQSKPANVAQLLLSRLHAEANTDEAPEAAAQGLDS